MSFLASATRRKDKAVQPLRMEPLGLFGKVMGLATREAEEEGRLGRS